MPPAGSPPADGIGSAPVLIVAPLFFEAFIPWQRALGITLDEVLSLLAGYGYRFAFQCPEGLIDHQPTKQQPCPAQYEHGYNVLAYLTRHAERVQRLARLRPGGKVPPMQAPPVPNR